MLAVCSNVCQFFTDRHDGHIAFTLPPLTSSLRITSCHNHAEKRRVSIATVPQEPEGVLKKHSTETKQMLQELDKEVGETESTEQTITELPDRTPEPEILHVFPELRNGAASKPECVRRHSSYEPRYCWCTRCQIMYRMYKENDHSLEGWGKYPCFHLWKMHEWALQGKSNFQNLEFKADNCLRRKKIRCALINNQYTCREMTV